MSTAPLELATAYILRLMLWREARNQSPEAIRAVLHVAQNRAKDKRNRWPNDILRVILQPWQFSSFNANDPNAIKMPHPDSSEWAAWEKCCGVADDPGDDPTDGATMYHSGLREKLPVRQQRYFPRDKFTVKIGAFRFYKV